MWRPHNEKGVRVRLPVTEWESDGGEDRRGQERSSGPLGAEIMIYSEEIHSSPVCDAERKKTSPPRRSFKETLCDQ